MTAIDYSVTKNLMCDAHYLDFLFILACVLFLETLNKENSLKKFSGFSDWQIK